MMWEWDVTMGIAAAMRCHDGNPLHINPYITLNATTGTIVVSLADLESIVAIVKQIQTEESR